MNPALLTCASVIATTSRAASFVGVFPARHLTQNQGCQRRQFSQGRFHRAAGSPAGDATRIRLEVDMANSLLPHRRTIGFDVVWGRGAAGRGESSLRLAGNRGPLFHQLSKRTRRRREMHRPFLRASSACRINHPYDRSRPRGAATAMRVPWATLSCPCLHSATSRRSRRWLRSF
jgi:hypothetical protein